MFWTWPGSKRVLEGPSNSILSNSFDFFAVSFSNGSTNLQNAIQMAVKRLFFCKYHNNSSAAWGLLQSFGSRDSLPALKQSWLRACVGWRWIKVSQNIKSIFPRTKTGHFYVLRNFFLFEAKVRRRVLLHKLMKQSIDYTFLFNYNNFTFDLGLRIKYFFTLLILWGLFL